MRRFPQVVPCGCRRSSTVLFSAAALLIGFRCVLAFGPAQTATAFDQTGTESTQAATPSATVRIFLVGDSTVAEKSGWGPGFTEFLTPEASCANLAAGGRSSRSFRNEGRWEGKIESNLIEHASATAMVAREKNVPLLDLHKLSIEQCNKLGPAAMEALEPKTAGGPDHTHLNAAGSRAVGELVAAELARIVPALSRYIRIPGAGSRDRRQATGATGKQFKLKETDATIEVSRGTSLVVVYNKQSPPVPGGLDDAYRRSGFLHPVASPAGQVVTDTFPFDHPHQHGIFSAWVRTTYDGAPVDFWNLAGGTGRVLHERVVSTFDNEQATGFEVDLIHRAQLNPPVEVLRERWKVSVYPTDGSYHCFDLETTQRALTPKPLFIAKYHYGGIALRGPVRWLQENDGDAKGIANLVREPSSFLNSLGSDRLKGNLEHARWVSLSGTIDGKAVSIAVLCHADNFRSPQAARLHPTKPYFCFAPCVDGDFTIDKDHPLKAWYRYLITDAPPDAEWLDRQWQQWCGNQGD